MTRKELENIMQRNMIFSIEIDDAITFISELLEHWADEIERNEPYAIRSIQGLRSAADRVWNLQDYIGDVTEE